MKLTTIIIGVLLLAGCAGIGFRTLNLMSVKQEEKIKESAIKGEIQLPQEPIGGSGNMQRSPMPAPIPRPVFAKPIIGADSLRTQNRQDDVQTNLFTASLAFVLRDKANVSEDIKAQLLIDPTQGIEQLEKELTVRGQRISKKIEVSKIVTAKITAPDFDVTLITPEEQILSFTKPTEWLWTLSPKSSGKFEVNLSVNAVITVNGRETSHHLKTFDKTIVIEITNQQIVKNWIDKNWQWVIGSIIIPLLVFFLKDYVLNLFKRKKKS